MGFHSEQDVNSFKSTVQVRSTILTHIWPHYSLFKKVPSFPNYRAESQPREINNREPEIGENRKQRHHTRVRIPATTF